jgi:hypothetical protein
VKASPGPRTLVLYLFTLGGLAIGCGGGTIGDSGDGGANGNGDGGGVTADARPAADAEVCAQSSAQATLESKPIDIIFVIDNSGSMTAEIAEVEYQINANFASIIDAATPAIDYRVIMLSRFGDSGSQDICVAQPLGGIPDADNDGHCDNLPSQPVNTTKFFHHSISIASHDSLCKLLSGFNTADEFGLQPGGYQDVLRANAFKFIVVVTDDGINCSSYNDGNSVAGGQAVAPDWDTALLTLSPTQFGTASDRNYSFWSIVALAPYMATTGSPYGMPHPPDATMAPVITGECTPSAVDPGTGYQALSILTGGYRYPTCGLDYTDMFQLMAQGVIAGSRVACEFAVPDPPPGETLDLTTVQVRYSSNGSIVDTFDQVTSMMACSTTANQFYIENNTIKLCPTACTQVQGDGNAEIDILDGCELGGID